VVSGGGGARTDREQESCCWKNSFLSHSHRGGRAKENLFSAPHRIELFSRESDRKIFADGIWPRTHTRQVLQIEYMRRCRRFVFYSIACSLSLSFGVRDAKVNECATQPLNQLKRNSESCDLALRCG
jgi:hypothetical protein